MRRLPSFDISGGVDDGVDAGAAVRFFIAGWLAAQVLALVAVSIITGSTETDERSIGDLAILLAVAWSVQLAAVWQASVRSGTGSMVEDFGLHIRPIDLAALGVGAATQVAVVPALYAPLRAVWPDTFSPERLEETARELADRAQGPSMLLLVLLVTVGAPIVEEVVYRGLLQRPRLEAVSTRRGRLIVVVAVAAVFAGLHFRPVEFVGLFAFGLVAGALAAASGRIGPAIMAHIGFNAVGILLVS